MGTLKPNSPEADFLFDWDDVITRALWAQAYDAQAKTDVLWGVYERDEDAVLVDSSHVFKGFTGGLERLRARIEGGRGG